METEILEQIVISLESWREHDKVGEEVRAMEETIRDKFHNNLDPVMDALLEIIEKSENDYQLGKILRTIYIPLKVILNDPPNT